MKEALAFFVVVVLAMVVFALCVTGLGRLYHAVFTMPALVQVAHFCGGVGFGVISCSLVYGFIRSILWAIKVLTQ